LCGCGKTVNTGKKYVWGHNGFILTKEQETKRRDCISKAMKGKPCSDYRKQKLVEYNKNPENRAKMSEIHKKLRKEHPEKFDNFSTVHQMLRNGILQSGNKGKKASVESRKRYSEATKKKWQNPEYAKKVLSSGRAAPNKLEKYFNEILQESFPNTFKYVGDGRVTVSGKCPDFINIDGKKQIIELFGDYWHKGENPQDRIDFFEECGYSTLVIWESELRKNLEQTMDRVKEFISGGEENV
jgi:very-short-patch-repair endonuclease